MSAQNKEADSVVQLEYKENKTVAFLRLNRPARRNALNKVLIEALQHSLENIQTNKTVRAVILSGNGPDFCAGADLAWMKASLAYTRQENIADAKALAVLFETLQNISVPVVAVVQGAVFGGGLGLVACCDIVLASAEVRFCFSEVKLGLVPAIVAPFVAQVMPLREMQRYCLSAEVFGAEQAWRGGLVHEVYPEAALEEEALAFVEYFKHNGPLALIETKAILQRLKRDKTPQAAMVTDMVQKIADIRISSEAQEGMTAFFEKRTPAWGIKRDV